MRRFFFDTYDGQEKMVDREGLEYPDYAAARNAAARALADMARDALPDGQLHRFKVLVRDDEGPWFEADLSYQGRNLRQV
jgi:hypothetical protein